MSESTDMANKFKDNLSLLIDCGVVITNEVLEEQLMLTKILHVHPYLPDHIRLSEEQGEGLNQKDEI